MRGRGRGTGRGAELLGTTAAASGGARWGGERRRTEGVYLKEIGSDARIPDGMQYPAAGIFSLFRYCRMLCSTGAC